MSIGIIFALVSMVGFGLANGFTREPARAVGPAQALFITRVFFLIPALLLLLPFFPQWVRFDAPWYVWFGSGLIALLSYIPVYFFYRALEKGDAGVVSSLTNLRPVVTALLAIVVFQQFLNLVEWLAIVVIIAGASLLVLNVSGLRNQRTIAAGTASALVAAAGWGIFSAAIKIPIDAHGPMMAAMLIEIGVAAGAGIHLWKTNTRLTKPPRALWGSLFAVAACTAVGTVFLSLSLLSISLGVAAAITAASSLVTVAYGTLALGERLQPLQWVGAFTAVLGVVVLSLS